MPGNWAPQVAVLPLPLPVEMELPYVTHTPTSILAQLALGGPLDLRGLNWPNVRQSVLEGELDAFTQLLLARLVGANLTDANLVGLNLTRVNLTDATLIRANLNGVDLTRANLTRANLTRAFLRHTILDHAELTEATLIDAKLRHARFSHAILTGANLSHAKLACADFTDANLIGADLTHAYLKEAQFNRANLTGAWLVAARGGADFVDAILIDARLMRLDAEEANFTRANLFRADLTGAHLGRNTFIETDFTDAILYQAAIGESDCTNATFTRANLSRAHVRYVDFTGANLGNADFRGAHLGRPDDIGATDLNAALEGYRPILDEIEDAESNAADESAESDVTRESTESDTIDGSTESDASDGPPSTQLTLTRQSLQDDPAGVLQEWARRNFGAVHFQGESGHDAAGLTRELATELGVKLFPDNGAHARPIVRLMDGYNFLQLHASPRYAGGNLIFPAYSDGEELILKNFGALCFYLYNTPGVILGRILSDEFFGILPFIEMQRQPLGNWPPLAENVIRDFLDSNVAQVIANAVPDEERAGILDIPAGRIPLDAPYSSVILAARAFIDGMPSCPRRAEFIEHCQRDHAGVSRLIQGPAFNRETLAQSIISGARYPAPQGVRNAVEEIQAWIRNEDTPEVHVEQVLRFITGSTTLPAGEQVRVYPTRQAAIGASTCFRNLLVPVDGNGQLAIRIEGGLIGALLTASVGEDFNTA